MSAVTCGSVEVAQNLFRAMQVRILMNGLSSSASASMGHVNGEYVLSTRASKKRMYLENSSCFSSSVVALSIDTSISAGNTKGRRGIVELSDSKGAVMLG